MKEIQNYQKTLDDVKAKGHGQIERYVKEAPAIKDTIEKQLSNVQESYNSLLQTAVQIKNRLVDSLAKFKEYEDTLESIMQNLDEYEPIVSEEVEKEAESLEEALNQLETAKVSFWVVFSLIFLNIFCSLFTINFKAKNPASLLLSRLVKQQQLRLVVRVVLATLFLPLCRSKN